MIEPVSVAYRARTACASASALLEINMNFIE